MWVFTKAFDNLVIRIALAILVVFCFMAEGTAFAFGIIVTAIFIGSILLYDSYRKEQKQLEQKDDSANR